MDNSYSSFEIKPGKIIHICSKKETWEYEKKWVEVFCKNKQGANTKAYKWHIFSFENYPSISGSKAELKYNQQKAPEYVVLSNEKELAVVTDTLPQECDLSDFYVFPKNFAWTMAFTHEDGWLGPYFATHKNYEELNKQNMTQLDKDIQKQKEIEIAKKNGWL